MKIGRKRVNIIFFYNDSLEDRTKDEEWRFGSQATT
jgi:hypothetical protein